MASRSTIADSTRVKLATAVVALTYTRRGRSATPADVRLATGVIDLDSVVGAMMTTRDPPIARDLDAIAVFCRAHGVPRPSLSGSVLREDCDPRLSDADVCAGLTPGAMDGMGWSRALFGQAWSRLMQHRVDPAGNSRPWPREGLAWTGVPIHVDA